jgi:hypothetical protein
LNLHITIAQYNQKYKVVGAIVTIGNPQAHHFALPGRAVFVTRSGELRNRIKGEWDGCKLGIAVLDASF